MAADYFTVREFVRGVVDGRVVVRRPGARIRRDLAERLGIVEPPAKPTRPAGARTPAPKPSKTPARPKASTRSRSNSSSPSKKRK